ANPNKNAWFYLVLFVRFGTYQWVRFQIKIFFSPLRLVAKPRLARRAFGSDHRHNVGRLLILTRGEPRNCFVSLSGFLFRPNAPAGSRSLKAPSLKTTANAMRACCRMPGTA